MQIVPFLYCLYCENELLSGCRLNSIRIIIINNYNKLNLMGNICASEEQDGVLDANNNHRKIKFLQDTMIVAKKHVYFRDYQVGTNM